MSNIDYKSKYLKYKNKYEALKSQTGGQPKNVNTLDDFPVEGRLGNINKTDRDKAIKEYYEIFLEKINRNNNFNDRYQRLEMSPTVGRLFERLVHDVMSLSNQLDSTNRFIEKLSEKSYKLEHELKDHYHDISTGGMKNFVKNYNGPIPSFGNHTYDGPTIATPIDGPTIAKPIDEPTIAIPKIVPGDGQMIIPVQGKGTIATPVDGPKIVQGEGEGPNIVQGEGEGTKIVQEEGTKFEQKFNCTFNVGDVVVDRIEGYGIVYEIKGNELHVINDLQDYKGISDNELNWTDNSYHKFKLCNETQYFKKSTVYVSPQSLVDTFSRKWWYESEKQQILIDFIKKFNLKKPEVKKERKLYTEEFNK